MAREFKEVAATRIDMRKCGDNHDKIFGGERVKKGRSEFNKTLQEIKDMK